MNESYSSGRVAMGAFALFLALACGMVAGRLMNAQYCDSCREHIEESNRQRKVDPHKCEPCKPCKDCCPKDGI